MNALICLILVFIPLASRTYGEVLACDAHASLVPRPILFLAKHQTCSIPKEGQSIQIPTPPSKPQTTTKPHYLPTNSNRVPLPPPLFLSMLDMLKRKNHTSTQTSMDIDL